MKKILTSLLFVLMLFSGNVFAASSMEFRASYQKLTNGDVSIYMDYNSPYMYFTSVGKKIIKGTFIDDYKYWGKVIYIVNVLKIDPNAKNFGDILDAITIAYYAPQIKDMPNQVLIGPSLNELYQFQISYNQEVNGFELPRNYFSTFKDDDSKVEYLKYGNTDVKFDVSGVQNISEQVMEKFMKVFHQKLKN